MDKNEIRQLLERLGQAISSNDLKSVSACWTFPAMFLSDTSATVIADTGQLEKFMAQAVEAYRKQGIASTKPEIEQIDELSETLASVDVRWPTYDASGKEKASALITCYRLEKTGRYAFESRLRERSEAS